MKKFIVVRHGSYHNGRLNYLGRREMEDLAPRLKPHLDGSSVRMLTSTAPRALDSALLLANMLEIGTVEQHEVLWSDNTHRQDNEAALALIRAKFDGVDALIVVTHLEYAEELPGLFGLEVLGVPISRFELSKGECRMVLCEEKTTIMI